ncbi:MAG TPA: ABC transporter ATP-binding protein [Vicinamibacterales bacterium]|nr:ABC transporter ATP-binding protein [Vicinamibacterales bacterium]
MSAIETEGLTKDYLIGFWRPRPYRALDALTLTVEAGEVFGFLGPNGAGKSTTLKLLMQLIFPTAGSARILGSPVGEVAVRRRIGFLAENPYYYDYLTAEELLTYFARLFGYSSADAKTRVARVLDQVGLGAERRMRLRGFSKGMVQRVGLAQALLNDPEVVFLDEPMSGLDPLGRRDVRDLILGLRARGCTVFFSSHILSDAEALCDRVAIVAQGKLAASGRLNELLAFELQGWELVLSDVPAALLAALPARFETVTPLSHGRVAVKLASNAEPDRVMSGLRAEGARIESLNPIRLKLEDFFMQHVRIAQPRATAL